MVAPKFQTQHTYIINQDFSYSGDDYWDWSVWIEAPAAALDKVQSVTYVLHPTFTPPIVEIRDRSTRFRLETSGWGTFRIYAKLQMQDASEIHLEHELKLEYPDGTETDA